MYISSRLKEIVTIAVALTFLLGTILILKLNENAQQRDTCAEQCAKKSCSHRQHCDYSKSADCLRHCKK